MAVKRKTKTEKPMLPVFEHMPLDGFSYQVGEVKATYEEKPMLEATTLWDFPKQSYGKAPKGNNKYPGVTPAFIVWNLLQRYTKAGDLVVDPMAGSGTTVDVCREEGRRVIGYDVAPAHPEVVQNDARNIPLEDNSVDMVFIDSPYSDNVKYSDHPDCIGRISCEDERFFDELENVAIEAYRILKPGKVLGWLIGDQWVKRKFTPVGFKLHQRLSERFETVDVVCVVRRGQSSNTGLWYNRARRFNFYLRGFKYLLVMRKPDTNSVEKEEPRSVKWASYERGRTRSRKPKEPKANDASNATTLPEG